MFVSDGVFERKARGSRTAGRCTGKFRHDLFYCNLIEGITNDRDIYCMSVVDVVVDLLFLFVAVVVVY